MGEGDAGKDPMRATNLAGARAYGRLTGVYQFLHPSGDPVAQAKNLWDATGDTMPAFPPALDLESAPDGMTPQTLALWFLRCADAVEHLFGRPPMIYTYPWFEKSRVQPALTAEIADRFARCPLWMADYAHGESPAEGQSPFCPPPWRSWAVWQTSGNNSSLVSGIQGHVDHNVFNGDEFGLRNFLGLPPPAVTEMPTMPALPDVGNDDGGPPEAA